MWHYDWVEISLFFFFLKCVCTFYVLQFNYSCEAVGSASPNLLPSFIFFCPPQDSELHRRDCAFANFSRTQFSSFCRTDIRRRRRSCSESETKSGDICSENTIEVRLLLRRIVRAINCLLSGLIYAVTYLCRRIFSTQINERSHTTRPHPVQNEGLIFPFRTARNFQGRSSSSTNF